MKKKILYVLLFTVILGFTQAINVEDTIKGFHESVRRKGQAELVKIESGLNTMISIYEQKGDVFNLETMKKIQDKVNKNEGLRKKHAEINSLLNAVKTVDKTKTAKQIRLDTLKNYQAILDIYSSGSESIQDNFHAHMDTANFHTNKYQLFKELYQNTNNIQEKTTYEKSQIQELNNSILDLQKSIDLFYQNPEEYSASGMNMGRMLHVNQYKNYSDLAKLQKDVKLKKQHYGQALKYYQKAVEYFDKDCDESCKWLDENMIKDLKRLSQ